MPNLEDELAASPAAPNGPALMVEVEIVHASPTAIVGAGAGAAAEDAVTVISVDPGLVSSAGQFRRDSRSMVESYTQLGRHLQAASADWASRSGRMASMDPARLVAAAQRLRAEGRTDDAVEILTLLCENSPDLEEAWDALELLYASTGQFQQVIDTRRMWVEDAGGDSESVDRLADQVLRNGAEGYWQWRLDVLEGRASAGENVSSVYLAAAQAALGDADGAFASLRDAVSERDRRLMSLRTDAVWDVLRSDPRFSSLLRSINNNAARRRVRR